MNRNVETDNLKGGGVEALLKNELDNKCKCLGTHKRNWENNIKRILNVLDVPKHQYLIKYCKEL